MVIKKSKERPVSFVNMVIVDRSGFREVVMAKTTLECIKETVGDKDPDAVSLGQPFKSISCEEERHKMAGETEFGWTYNVRN